MKWNKPLIIGGIIICLLLIVMIAPHLITDKNPYSIRTLKYTVELSEGERVFEQAPFEPSENYSWGSDELGRDVFSFIIYGTRLTLLIALSVTTIRFLLALPLGLLAGFKQGWAKNIIRQVNILFSGLPPLLFAIVVLYLNIFTSLDKRWSTLAFIVVLVLVGFGKLASTFEESTKSIMAKPYITSEFLLGKTKYEIAIENILPHLMPEVVVLFFMELARVLTLQIQLGLFAIFIGNLKILLSDNEGVVRYWQVSYEPEWASLLGYATTALRRAPWMVIYPTLAFFLSVLGFNMFGEGLRVKLQDQTSDFIPRVRKVLAYIFLKKHRHTRPKLSIKVIVLVLVIGVAILVNMDFSGSDLGKEIYISSEDLPDRLYVGMDEIDELVTRLVEEMKSIGMSPVYEDFTKTYQVDQNYYIKTSELLINNDTYVQDKDYVIKNFMDVDELNGQVIVINDSLYDNTLYQDYKDKIILIDGSFYTDEALEVLCNDLGHAGCKAVLVMNHGWITSVGQFKGCIPLIGINDIEIETGDMIKFSCDNSLLGDTGINVIGQIKGQDQNASQEVIVIGIPLNYTRKEEALITYNYALEMIDALRDTSDRTLVLAFLDGTYDTKTHGMLSYSKGMVFDPYMHTVYFDIRQVNYGTGQVSVNKDMAPITDYFGVSFFQSLDKTSLTYDVIKETPPDQLMDLINHPTYVMHHKKGINTIVFDVNGDPNEFYNSFYQALKENN